MKKLQRFDLIWKGRVAYTQTYQGSFSEYSNAFGNYWSNPNCTFRDLSGKLIIAQALKGGDNEELVGISGLQSATYSVKLLGDGTQIEIEKLTVIIK